MAIYLDESSEELIEELKHLIINQKCLESLEPCFEKVSLSASPHKVIQTLAKIAGIPSNDTMKIVGTLARFRNIIDNHNTSPDELLNQLSNIVDSFEKDAQKNLWPKTKNLLDKIFSSNHPFSLWRKAANISYFYQNVLSDISIMTDIRPIFDSEGEDIKGSVVTQVIAIEYIGEDFEKKCIHIALDSADVRKLITSSERALSKAKSLKKNLEKLQWQTVILGEDDDV